MERKREEKVRADLLAMDATKASKKSNAYASKLKNQYGPQDSSTKLSVTLKKNSQKGASKSDSPAKRIWDEITHPVTADPTHYKT